MPPYAATKDGVRAFVSALHELIERLPIDCPIKYEPYRSQACARLVAGSLLCFGTAKEVLEKALHNALLFRRALDVELIEKCLLCERALSKMKASMTAGAANVRGQMREITLDDGTAPLHSDDRNATKKPSYRLKPGESKPSHRREAAEIWRTVR
jgi:hypothetical protein